MLFLDMIYGIMQVFMEKGKCENGSKTSEMDSDIILQRMP
jgi:hypothetical protein